jgi:hypothetical protein
MMVKLWLAPCVTLTCPLGEIVPLAPALAVMAQVLSVKVAVTLLAAFILIVQLVAVPEQPPDQPPKVESVLAAAIRVTEVRALKLVPDGLVVTVPLPVPALLMVRI